MIVMGFPNIGSAINNEQFIINHYPFFKEGDWLKGIFKNLSPWKEDTGGESNSPPWDVRGEEPQTFIIELIINY